ncbi:MAG: thioredoxin fold domain-containing protein [Balneolales bacterium]
MTIITGVIFAFFAGCAAESDAPAETSGQNESVISEVWYTLEEAQEKTSDDNKKIMVFVYTEWCGYCRRMDREVYSDEEVMQIFSDYYYPVRLNAESDKQVRFNGQSFSESELARAFGVTSYPTAVFLDGEGDPFGSQPGFIEKDMFQDILVFVGSDAYKSQSFQDFQRNK